MVRIAWRHGAVPWGLVARSQIKALLLASPVREWQMLSSLSIVYYLASVVSWLVSCGPFFVDCSVSQSFLETPKYHTLEQPIETCQG